MECENCGREGAVFVGSSKSYGPDPVDAENTADNLPLGKAYLCPVCIELSIDLEIAALVDVMSKPRIEHKIRSVADDVCAKCHQCWENECRAFEMSHSQEERSYRQVRGPECLLQLAKVMGDRK